MYKVTLLLFFFIGSCFAQSDDAAFSTIDAGLFYSHNDNRNMFHHFWDVEHGIKLKAEFPFYFGIIETVAQYDVIGSKFVDVPSFESINMQLLWGYKFYLTNWLSTKISCGPGIFQMNFDDDGQYDDALLTEREISINLVTAVKAKFNKTFGIEVGYSLTRVFTNIEIDLNYVYAGLVFTIESPEWLKDFLN